MSYSFTAIESAVLAQCAGDNAKLEAAFKAGTLSMSAIIAYTAIETAKQEAAKPVKLGIKMSDKGCVTITGVNGKFGVSLYPQQWLAVLAISEKITQFIAANEAQLKTLGDAEKARKATEKDVAKLNNAVLANIQATV